MIVKDLFPNQLCCCKQYLYGYNFSTLALSYCTVTSEMTRNNSAQGIGNKRSWYEATYDVLTRVSGYI